MEGRVMVEDGEYRMKKVGYLESSQENANLLQGNLA
jgi:hypothetical protein